MANGPGWRSCGLAGGPVGKQSGCKKNAEGGSWSQAIQMQQESTSCVGCHIRGVALGGGTYSNSVHPFPRLTSPTPMPQAHGPKMFPVKSSTTNLCKGAARAWGGICAFPPLKCPALSVFSADRKPQDSLIPQLWPLGINALCSCKHYKIMCFSLKISLLLSTLGKLKKQNENLNQLKLSNFPRMT